MFLLDTDHVSILQRPPSAERQRLSQRIGQFRPQDFFVAIVTFHEQVIGWSAYISKSKNERQTTRGYLQFQQLLTDFSGAQVLPYDDAAAGLLRDFRRQKIRIGTMDLRIACIAQSRQFTVLTRNAVDFSQVPGLVVEDWTT